MAPLPPPPHPLPPGPTRRRRPAGPAPNPVPRPPTPTPWPHQFHAKLLMDYKGNLSLADLWYDWLRGRNLHVIRYQLAADASYYDAEWNNGTSFFYTPARRRCRSAAVGVSILRPDWLVPGAAYVGRVPADGFDCHVWTKADFISYYEDASTGRPVKWVFYTGQSAHVISFDPGTLPDHVEWQAPAYCFTDDGGTAKDAFVSEADMHGDGSFIPKIRMLRGDQALVHGAVIERFGVEISLFTFYGDSLSSIVKRWFYAGGV